MNTTIITVAKSLDSTKLKNLFWTVVMLNFIWMFFHFTVVFFFTLQLNSVALVWFFLWIWNLFAFILDIPIWIIQNYFKSKTLYIIASISQLVAMLIFTFLILQVSIEIAKTTWLSDNSYVWLLFWNWLNILLLLIASFCYWLTKELQDVTTLSYILNNANPSQYNSILSKNNIAMWIWSLIWLVLSWIVLTYKPILIIIVMIIFIWIIILFTKKYFDNSEKSFNLIDVYNFTISQTKEWFRKKITKTVNKIELKNIISSTKYLFLKPVAQKSWLSFEKLMNETKKSMILTYKVLSRTDSPLIVYWSMTVLLTFWFRDTFASIFLIDFLNNIKEWWSYILLWIIAIPAFWLQWFFSKLAWKFWNLNIANLWLILSWTSLVFMWLYSNSSILLIMFCALLNSVWYAACMWLSQSVFLDSYNKSYADFNNLKEIDANSSAAPMKILQNLANVFWLVLWWLILFILKYKWFFITFWLFMIWLLIWWITRKKYIND